MATSARKTASARTSARKTTSKPGPKPGQATNKDGTPRKKPGPAKGTPRGQKSTATRKARTKKSFLLYTVEGNELSYVCEAAGATGQIAATNAVKNGDLAPDTPVVFLPPAKVAVTVEVEAVEREVQYKVKKSAGRKPRRSAKVKPAVGPDPVPEPDPAESAPATSARTSARKSAAPAEPQQAAPQPGGNPFAD